MRAAGVSEGGRGYPRAEGRSAPWKVPVMSSTETVPEEGPNFRSCREARAAGAAPMYRGQPGYNPALDGDGDGIACEPSSEDAAKADGVDGSRSRPQRANVVAVMTT